jgi:excisionase family DNA binding protein
MTKTAQDRFITVQHVSERLSCTTHHVYRLIEMGAIEAIKIGPRAVRISENSLIEFIEVQQLDPGAKIVPEEKPRTEQRTDRVARSSWMSK